MKLLPIFVFSVIVCVGCDSNEQSKNEQPIEDTHVGRDSNEQSKNEQPIEDTHVGRDSNEQLKNEQPIEYTHVVVEKACLYLYSPYAWHEGSEQEYEDVGNCMNLQYNNPLWKGIGEREYKAIELEKDTKVRIRKVTEYEARYITVAAGKHKGESGWINKKYLLTK